MKPSIAIIIGTRAELIKTFPLMLELKKEKLPYIFIHTGQHSLSDLCKKLGVSPPDLVLTKEPEKSTKFYGKKFAGIAWLFSVILKVRKLLKNMPHIKYVLYHGDTISTVAAAVGTSRILNPFKTYSNMHLEAGLRSWNWREPFPEEISRVIAGRFSDILLAVSKGSMKNISSYKSKRVVLVGNTIIDSAKIALELAKKKKIKPLSPSKFALISIHRHESLQNKERMEKIIDSLMSLEVPSFFTLHDNTRSKLEEYGLLTKLLSNSSIKIIAPLDYVSYVYQLANCSLIICDGGSLQEESLIFKKPCIVMRRATERQEGLKSNFQFLTKLDPEKTKRKIQEYLSPKFRIQEFKNPYGNEEVSKKIIEYLR